MKKKLLIFFSFFVSLLLVTPSINPSIASETTPTWIQASTNGPAPDREGPVSGYDAKNDRMIIFGGYNYSTGKNLNDVWLLTNANGLSGTPQWINLIPNGAPGSPSPRHAGVGVYDQANNRLIIFSGCAGYCYPKVNDTWVLTHANGLGGTPQWIQLSPSGVQPVGRNNARAVYDPVSNRMMLFAGQDGSGGGGATYNDTWVLTNANGLGGTPQWIQLFSNLPVPGQYMATAVYDSANNRMTVFGGTTYQTDQYSNAVWVLSNANGLGGTPQWTNLVPEGASGSPTARTASTAVYDSTTNRMIIFGGQRRDGISMNDVWTLSNANGIGGVAVWTRENVSNDPPHGRHSTISGYNPSSNRLIIFGGASWNEDFSILSAHNDTWILLDANGIMDSTPPVITPHVNPEPNAAGWNNSDVTVSWDISDSESVVTASSGCDPVTITDETVGETFTCTAISAGGTESQTVTVKLDKTQPVIVFTDRTAANANGWNKDNVTVNWACSDALSGITSETTSKILSSEGADQSATGTCTDLAGNEANDTQNNINIDKTVPSVSINSPAGTVSTQTVPIDIPINDNTSGIDTYSYTIDDTSLDKSASSLNLTYYQPGDHLLNITATDKAGNNTTKSGSFTYSPVVKSLSNGVSVMYSDGNITKLGSSITDKLTQAQSYIDAKNYAQARSALQALTNQVQAQIDIHITADAGNILISQIQYLINSFQNI